MRLRYPATDASDRQAAREARQEPCLKVAELDSRRLLAIHQRVVELDVPADARLGRAYGKWL